MKPILIVAAGLLLFQTALIAQTDTRSGQHRTSPLISPDFEFTGPNSGIALSQLTEGEEVFRAIQRGLLNNDFDELARHFGKHIYLNIRSIESGHYSANQAQFVVQNFFNMHKPLSFSFTTYGESGGAPYATGRGSINVKGNREYIQVYVSLSKQKDRWVISQFNIY